MSDPIKFYSKDAAKNPDYVLKQAIGQYQDVLILGWTKEGELDARASLELKHSDILWLIELFKHNLVSGEYDDD